MFPTRDIVAEEWEVFRRFVDGVFSWSRGSFEVGFGRAGLVRASLDCESSLRLGGLVDESEMLLLDESCGGFIDLNGSSIGHECVWLSWKGCREVRRLA